MIALLFGVSDYDNCAKLKNPKNDAKDLNKKLKDYGFKTRCFVNCSIEEAEEALDEFAKELDGNDVALFFFAGHGFQTKGNNYLAVSDTKTKTESGAKHSSIPLNRVLDEMDNSNASTNIVILDACRDDPWARSWSRNVGTRGLASVFAPKGTIIGYATSPGEFAYDGEGRNGVYTGSILKHMDEKDSSIENMFKKVRNTVAAVSKGKQTTWEHTSLSGYFYFNKTLGKMGFEYSASAFADSKYKAEAGSLAQEIIRELKSSNWYRQNPAISSVNAKSAHEMGVDDLFVVGRNIYQSACGGSGGAVDFINSFHNRTHKWEAEKTKSLLDGILFEIFFNSQGDLRADIKSGCFNEVFELEEYDEYENNFKFISECLAQTNLKLYSMPGSNQTISLTINVNENGVVDSIYLDSKEILEVGETDAAIRYDLDHFEEILSRRLVVPTRRLDITYTEKKPEGLLVLNRSWNVKGWPLSAR